MRASTTLAALAFALCAVATPRETVNMNFGWLFHAGDLTTIPTPSNVGAITADWRTVDLPHDYQIEQPWVAPGADEQGDASDQASNFKSRLSARGFKEMGIGWYVKTLTPPAEWKNRLVLLDFQGIMYVGDVYLNGERVGGTDYGYLGFEVDVSKLLRIGQENVIAVKANTQEPLNSRWYTGGGLFRDVKLFVTDRDLHFARHPLYITTPVVSDTEATVAVQAEIACNLRTERLKVHTVVRDADGTLVADDTTHIAWNRKMKVYEYRLDDIHLSHPRLWSCETPHLYRLTAELCDEQGRVADQVESRFGVRTIEYGPDFGFKLNGKKVIWKGIANHHSLGALGSAAYPRAIEKRLKMLKEWGFNHVRTSHNPYSEDFLNLCDENGILVVDELYDKWLTQFTGGRREWTEQWQKDVPEFVKRDRNHPCVVLWSLGNELQTYANLPYNDWGVTAYRLQKTLLQRYDSTRLVTVAMHPRGRSLETDSLPAPLALETDIAAYNYRYMYFPGDGRRFPWMIFYQSEANLPMMGPNYYEMDLNRVVGLAYWGMIDYLGESRGWPAKGWSDGVFDITLEPKPMAWFLRSVFKEDEPVVHLSIVDDVADNTEWNGVKFGGERYSDHWNRTPGKKLTVYAYSNAEEVELIVNGKSQGRRSNPTDAKSRNKMRWDNVVYADGYAEAVAYRDGKVVARHRIETAGPAKRLVLTPDKQEWLADGTDLMHVRVNAVDGKGRRSWTCQDELVFSVEGDARIVAVSNGDMLSDELNATNTRSLYNGSALVILRAGKTGGKVTLTARQKSGGKTTKLTLLPH
ncbi:MAG: DUF4982 domain-containing protein [Prevotella sp.]|nr:DUF4982 domain-containing protein [Prevotella sp.]